MSMGIRSQGYGLADNTVAVVLRETLRCCHMQTDVSVLFTGRLRNSCEDEEEEDVVWSRVNLSDD